VSRTGVTMRVSRMIEIVVIRIGRYSSGVC